MPILYLSASRSDRDAARRLAETLTEGSGLGFAEAPLPDPARPWLPSVADLLSRARGSLVCLGRHGPDPIQARELGLILALSTMPPSVEVHRPHAVAVALLPGGDPRDALSLGVPWVDLGRGSESRDLEALRQALEGHPPATDRSAVNPYQGLAPFSDARAGLFFGRREDLQRLHERLRSGPVAAVTGAAGCGKTSLLQAGLVPALRRSFPPLAAWECMGLALGRRTPGAAPGILPLHRLCTAVLRRSEPQLESGAVLERAYAMGDRLAAGDLELTEVLRRVLEGSGATRLLLVVDDFHLLARGVDGHDRNAFLAGLEGAMGALPLSLCVAFRSECYTELMDLISGFGRATELAGALEHGLLHLGPLRAEQIAEAIEGPARLTGLGLEDGLLDTIVADTLTAPGGPAALSLALEQTWRQHRENLLSAEGYARIGGAVGVLGRQAEQGFHLLDPERRRRMRDAVTARLAWVPECPLLADEGGHSLAAWPRARAWLEEEQGFVLWRRELHRALARWQNQGQNPVAALQPSAQLEAQAWLKRRQEDLTSEEQEFIRLGTKSPGGGESTAKRRPWRRPHSVRRAAGWFMAGMGVAGVALILALWRVAPPGTGRVAGSGVSAQGVASHDRGAAAEAEQSLRGRAHLRVKEMSFRQGTAVEDIAFNPESVLAVAGRDGIARLWNPVEKTLLLTLEGHRLAITRLAFSADGKRLATAGRDRSVRVWDSAGGRLLHTLTGHLDAINDVAFSHDGRYIAAAGDDHSVRLWNATTGQLLHSFTEHVAEVDRIAFSPDDRLLLSTTGDGSAWLWSLADRRLIARLGGHTGIIEKAAFSPDGRLIAGVGAMPEVRLWKAADGSPLQRLAGHSGTIHDIAFAPDSKRLATAGDDATVRLWSLSDDTPPLVLDRHEDAVRKVVFGPRGRLLASIGDDRLAFLRDARSGLRILTLGSWTRDLTAIAFSADGRWLAVGSEDGYVRLWDLRGLPAKFTAAEGRADVGGRLSD